MSMSAAAVAVDITAPAILPGEAEEAAIMVAAVVARDLDSPQAVLVDKGAEEEQTLGEPVEAALAESQTELPVAPLREVLVA